MNGDMELYENIGEHYTIVLEKMLDTCVIDLVRIYKMVLRRIRNTSEIDGTGRKLEGIGNLNYIITNIKP